MASSTRNHTIKRDIQGTILSRIAVNGLIVERYDALFYEILQGLDLPNLETQKQMSAILFASCSCNIIAKIDCRQVMTDQDFQEKLVEFQSIDDLWNQYFKLFATLNSGASREKTKDAEATTNIGEELQHLLSRHLDADDMRSNTDQD